MIIVKTKELHCRVIDGRIGGRAYSYSFLFAAYLQLIPSVW